MELNSNPQLTEISPESNLNEEKFENESQSSIASNGSALTETVQEVEVKRKRLNKTEKKKQRFERLLENYKIKKAEKKKQKEEARLEKEAQIKDDSNQDSELGKEDQEASNTVNKSTILYETFYNKRELKKSMLNRLKQCYDDNSNSLKVCIDCSFIDHMTDKEMSRLAQQIGRCYATNKSLTSPVYLSLANLGPESKLYRELCRVNDGFQRYIINITEKSVENYFLDKIDSVAYLSPDSSTFLEELDAETIYVIGGLVDETVAKKVTLNKCAETKIRSYALPIEKYLSRKVTSTGELDFKNFNYNKILTINQVFDILTNRFLGKDWPTALEIGVPKRKGFYAGKNCENSETVKNVVENLNKENIN